MKCELVSTILYAVNNRMDIFFFESKKKKERQAQSLLITEKKN